MSINPRELRGGTDPETVFGRVAEQFRYAASTGASEAESRQAALTRLETIADDNLKLAERHVTRESYAKSKVVTGYRRIVHPELSTTGTCGLCIAAADRRYRKAELLPCHGHCRCTTLPIIGKTDPGLALNSASIKALYSAAGGTDASALSNTRYTVEDHSELGPILREAGQRFLTRTQADNRPPSDNGTHP